MPRKTDARYAKVRTELSALAEGENNALRFWAEPDAKALPAPATEKVITPPLSAITPPGERADRPENMHQRPGADDWKVDRRRNAPTIDVKAEPVKPARNMPAPGLSFVPGLHGAPAKPGHVTEAQRQRVNADRSIEHRVMNQPVGRNGVQPSNQNESWRSHTGGSNPGFFWDGKHGRSW